MRPPSAARPPPKPSWSFSFGGVVDAFHTTAPPEALRAVTLPAASSVNTLPS